MRQRRCLTLRRVKSVGFSVSTLQNRHPPKEWGCFTDKLVVSGYVRIDRVGPVNPPISRASASLFDAEAREIAVGGFTRPTRSIISGSEINGSAEIFVR